MPIQAEHIIAPRGGLNYSQRADLISPLEMTACQNVFFEDGLIKKRYGLKLFGGNLPLSGPIMGFDQYYQFGGNSFLLVMTTKDIYQWNPTNKEWDLLTENTVVDNCDDDPVAWTASTNVEVYRETTEKKEGTASLKIKPLAAFTTGLLAYHDIASKDLSAYNHVRFWVKPTIAMSAGHLQFLLDNTAACVSPLRTIDLPALTANTWKLVLLDIRDQEGSTSDLNAIVSIGLKATSDFGPCDIYVDDFKAYKCFTGTDKDFFHYDYIRKKTEDEPWWICSNGVDNIKKFTGNTFGDLGGTPPKAKLVIEFKDHLHLLYTIEAGKNLPQRDRWSDTGNPEEWNTGNAKYNDMAGADFIQAAYKFKGDFLSVFKDRSIRMGMPSGDSNIFEFPLKQSGIGPSAGRTVESLGDELAFLGWDDVYAFDGIDYVSIADKVKTELFRTLNPKEMERSFSVIVEEQKEYHLFVTQSGESYPNIDWCFNYDLNVWTKNKYSPYILSYGYYFLEQATRWCDLVGAWAEQTWRWGDRTLLAYSPTTLYGDKDGNVYEYSATLNNDNAVAIDAYFDTKDFKLQSKYRSFLQFFGICKRQIIVGMDVYYKGPSLSVYYSPDKGSTWTLITTLSASTNFDIPKQVKGLHLNCRQVRLRFRNAKAGEHFEFDSVDIYWKYGGARL